MSHIGSEECMEDWYDYEWRKEQKEMDHRRKWTIEGKTNHIKNS